MGVSENRQRNIGYTMRNINDVVFRELHSDTLILALLSRYFILLSTSRNGTSRKQRPREGHAGTLSYRCSVG